MKILIAGLGSIGRRHLRNLQQLGERDILLYRTYRSTLPDDELAGLPVETDLQTALAHKPQAVIISNPSALHLEVAIPAAQAGCHLLIEKPLSHSQAGTGGFVEVARQSGSRVLVGYQFRFHPGLQQARRLLMEGRIGKVFSAHAHWGEYLPGWHPWEDSRLGYSARAELGGGVVLTLSHHLDTLRWLLGEVAEVWAFTGRLSQLVEDVEDNAEIGLRFAQGALASVHLDYCQRPPENYLEIVGDLGTLRWDNTSASLTLQNSDGMGESEIHAYPPPPGFNRNQLFLAEMRHFLQVVRGEAESICDLQDGLQTLDLALAALQSAQQQRLVKL